MAIVFDENGKYVDEKGFVKLEGLEASKEEIGEAVALICRQNKITVEELKPHYDAQFEQAVIKSVLTGKVLRLIQDAADITVV